MTGFRRLLHRILSTLRRDSAERQLQRELAAHLEMLEENFRGQGMSAADARSAARREFGGIEQVKEEYRDRRGFVVVEQLVRDVIYALRALAKSPTLTLTAIVSLALGIGVNSAIFTLLNGLVLETLPVPHPERLVEVQQFNKPMNGYQNFFSYAFYRELSEENDFFDGITAQWGTNSMSVRMAGGEERNAAAMYVSGTYFQFLHAYPYLGRLLTKDDDGAEGAQRVCVISFKLWQKLWNGDPHVIGHPIVLNDKPAVIVGVTAPEFTGLGLQSGADLIVPTALTSYFGQLHRDNPSISWLSIMAHLKPGIDRAHASERLNALANRIDRPGREKARFRVEPAPRGFDRFGGTFRQPLFVLMSAVGLVLLVACLNLANLLLVRGQARGREIAVRLSLGASRGRIVRQLLFESIWIALAGAAVGWPTAMLVVRLLVTEFNKGKHYGLLDLTPDAHVLFFTAAVATVTVLLFGFMPAWLTSGVSLVSSLGGSSQSAATQERTVGLRRSLLCAQIALTMLLLFAASLFERSLRNLRAIDIGSDPEHLVMGDLALNSPQTGKRYADPSLLDDLYARSRHILGIVSLAYAAPSILSGGLFATTIEIPGRPSGSSMVKQSFFSCVSPGYFHTIGAPMLRGRDFTDADRAGSHAVAIVNEKFASVYFPNEDPLGKQFLGAELDQVKQPTEIVGVAKDMPFYDLREDNRSMVYRPAKQVDTGWQVLTARVAGNPEVVTHQLQELIHSLSPAMPPVEFTTLAVQRDARIARERLIALLSTLFGLLALALSAVGLYGLVAYSVAKRTPEIGIRVSVGAAPRAILAMLLQENLVLAGLGVAMGAVLAVAATRLVRGLLYGLPVVDWWSIAFSGAVLLVISLVAILWPALRATKIDPVQALRYE